MSKNFLIILAFLISGIIFGFVDSIFFYIPLIWLPAYLMYKQMDEDIFFTGIIVFIIFLIWWINLLWYTLLSYIVAFWLLFSRFLNNF